MGILKNKEVWLRNTQCMNDYLEVQHGINCLVKSFNSDAEGKEFKEALNGIHPNITDEIAKMFDGWLPHLRMGTYITCISEHPKEENKYGRLSMWRAYGGKRSVALVLNRTVFASESDAFQAYTYPVWYLDEDDFRIEFLELAYRIKQNSDFVSSLGRENVKKHLFHLFKAYALCVKHPGFSEEREWRIIYNPTISSSDNMGKSIESINNIPQEIYKIPLKDVPEENYFGGTIPDLIKSIIIGPNDHQTVIGSALTKLLSEAGCINATERIKYSGIPLRS